MTLRRRQFGCQLARVGRRDTEPQRAKMLRVALDQLEVDAVDLLEAEDADEREDLHMSLMASLEELGEALP